MKKNTFKKLLAIVLVFTMLAPIMGHLGTNASEVQAADEEKTVGYKIVDGSDVTETILDGVTIYNSVTYPNYVFAGWYTDDKATTVATTVDARFYAKFLPEGVLSTKVQVTNGIVTNTKNESYRNKYVMRFVSSVDSTDYNYAGFELSYIDKTTNEKVTMTSKTYKVFKRIDSTTGVTANNVDTYNFSPKVLDTKSEYFITGKLPVAEADKAVDYTVKAYWVTKDGTKVYGRERCVSVEDGTTDTAKTRLNLTVDAELSKDITYTATYSGWDPDVVKKNIPVEVLTIGNGYSNIRITNADKNMKSVTKVYIKTESGTLVTEASYRNLYSKYEDEEGNTKFDTSWYSASENEYIIATRADMYGLAQLIDGGEAKYPFTNKSIYLVSDVALNPEKMELQEGDNYLKWYTYDEENQKVYQDMPSHNWNPIGYHTSSTSYSYFPGTFDGQGHTISGLYINTSTRFAGLFGAIDTSATITNVKLKSSYIKTSAADVGSIVAMAKGKVHTVYSDSIVECGNSRSGGMVGQASGSDVKMINCWFAGCVTNTSAGTQLGTGGLVGVVSNSAKLTMQSCFNSGMVDVTAGATQPYVGGIVGQVGQGKEATLIITDSLNTGKVKLNGTQKAITSNHGFGTIVGYVNTNASSNITNTYADKSIRTMSAATGTTNTGGPQQVSSFEAFKGTDAKTNMSLLNWNSTWVTVPHGIPVLSVFEKEVFDTSWYDEDNAKSFYVLKDKGDLYGLAELSKTYDFEGITIQLANDIIVNSGNAEDWALGVDKPYYNWTPISPSTLAFKGTFDANMNTISGLYLESTARYGGLFATTAGTTSAPTIQNLSLKNSYFKTTNSSADFGSVVGRGCGTFDSIYSDAIVVVQGERAGGMIGQINEASTVNNCWYAGKFSNIGIAGRYHGGLVGYVGAELMMTNCLNTGTIQTCTSNKRGMTGGLIGFVATNITVTMNSCMNVGLVQQDSTETTYFGPIVGYNSGTVNTASTYAIKESSRTHDGSNMKDSAGNLKYKNPSESDLLAAAETVVGVLGNDVWTTVAYRTPVLKTFKNESDGRVDVSWFDEAAYDTTSEYILYDEEDLYGFAMISKVKDFSGKTVKLGADIVVNEGTASIDWTSKSNYRPWMTIGSINSSTKLDFRGTFDGQGYTISGLYLNTSWRYAGLFASVGSDGIVQNVKLTNSYFKSTGRDFGGIAGVAAGKFYNVYNSAIMNGKHWTNGGFVGLTNGDNVVMEKCWFAGTLTNEYNPDASNSEYHQGTGGLVGLVYSGKVTMTNCLNSGAVSLPNYNKSKTRTNTDTGEEETYVCSNVGGLIGSASAEVTMHGCLNAGEITYNSDVELTLGYGPLVGFSGDKGNVSMSATYATDGIVIDDPRTVNNTTANYEVVTEVDIQSDAEAAMPLLSWGTVWGSVEDALPEIIFDYTGSASGLNVVTTSEEETQLASLYEGRLLYQGEMHDHAQTYGRGLGALLGDDGTVSLATWKEQMKTLDLDFAASLDHNQIDHIEHEDWDESKFIYGSEASATITNDEGTQIGSLHFDMIFKTKAQFQSIIDKYSSRFNFDTTTKLFGYTGLVFTKTEFKTFIKDIMQAGGVFNLPHPLQNDSYSATELEDYYFEVIDESQKQLIYGFQVFRGNTSNPDTLTNYVAWVDMLSKGYRVYATAGADSHGELNVNTLTSIYGTTCENDCSEGCTNENCARSNKGNLLTQLASGDFTVGAVGIQMSIGSTLMGGSCDFTTRNRLIVGIGEIHSGMLVDGHKYRVEILNENGVVYSQQIATDGTTKIALDTVECDFYRVEVYDGTTGVRIAIGNPIWNEK